MWMYMNLGLKLKAIRCMLCPWLPLSACPLDISYTMGGFACWYFIKIQLHKSNLTTSCWWAEWKRSCWLCHGYVTCLRSLWLKKLRQRFQPLCSQFCSLTLVNCEAPCKRSSGKPPKPYFLKYWQQTDFNETDFCRQVDFNWRNCLKLVKKSMDGRNPFWVFREHSFPVWSTDRSESHLGNVSCLKVVYFLHGY